MKVLVQNLLSLKFFGTDGDWTRNIDEALDFGAVLRAMEMVRSRGLDRVRVLAGTEEMAELGAQPLRAF